jgi:addiction module RelB/DinJ family antitoxin
MTQQTKNELFSVRIDPALKADAAQILSRYGLNLSDAVRMLFTRITVEGGLPAGLIMSGEEHDFWFREKVMAALASSRPKRTHKSVMERAEAAIRLAEAERA